MRLVRLAVKLGMKLARDEERMISEFYDFNQLSVRGESTEHIIGTRKLFPVGIVKFIPMSMALVHNEGSIKARSFCSHYQLARLRA